MENPGSSAFSEYCPGVKAGKLKAPVWSLGRVSTSVSVTEFPLTVLLKIVRRTPGMTAPVQSDTVPDKLPSPCTGAGVAATFFRASLGATAADLTADTAAGLGAGAGGNETRGGLSS